MIWADGRVLVDLGGYRIFEFERHGHKLARPRARVLHAAQARIPCVATEATGACTTVPNEPTRIESERRAVLKSG